MRPFGQFARLAVLATLLGCGGTSPVAPPRPPPAPVVTAVEVAAPGRSLVPGDTLRLVATVKDQNGNPMTGRPVTWTSNSDPVATVSAAGLVTAVTQGQATISATAEGRTGSAVVTVDAPAAAIALDRAEAVVEVGTTLQLRAAVTDAQGNALQGRRVVWTSTSPEVASVSEAGLVSVRHGATSVVATVEGKADTAAIRVPVAPLALTLGAGAVTRTVGPAGDTLRTRAPDGTTYQLAIPPLALTKPVAITMTPITAASGLPLSGGLIGGVNLEPSGLVFVQSATLVIGTTRTAPAGQRPVGLSYRGTGDELTMAAAGAGTGTVTLPVPHFSGALAGFGTTQDIESLYFATRPPPRSGAFYAAELLMASTDVPRDVAFERQILDDWWNEVVMPAITGVTTDLQLIEARGSRNDWERTGELAGTFALVSGGVNTVLGPRRGEWDREFVRQAKRAVEANLTLCRTPGLLSGRITGLDNALFWYRLATFGHPEEANAEGVTLSWIRGLLCAAVVTDLVALPDPLLTGTNTLDVHYRLRFAPDNVTTPADFRVTPSVTGATHALPGATAASPQGFYTGTLVPNAGGNAVTILLTACYTQGETAFALGTVNELCGDQFIARGSGGGFNVDYQGALSMGSAPCNRQFRETVTRFVNVSDTSVCGAGGWSRTGSYTLAGTLSKARLETAMAKSGPPQNFHPGATVSARVADRITINAPGQTGNIGSFRGQIEVRAIMELDGGVCNPVSSQGRIIPSASVTMEGSVGDGTPFQQMFPNTRIAISGCGGPSANPWAATTTVFSTDMVFRYGVPFTLALQHAASSAVTQTGNFISGSGSASVRYEYRWLGMLGLPAGATVSSATGFDWSTAALP
ncbi:MAG: Ig-like domain-containing protein [Gemmatimonadales bacterium]|nr:Ig-like domain-containing protein [Gemmatimonadales bacterium]